MLQLRATFVKLPEQIDADQKVEVQQELTASSYKSSNKMCQKIENEPSTSIIPNQVEQLRMPLSETKSLLQKQENIINNLNNENFNLKEILQGIREERDSLREKLKDLDGLENHAKMLKEKIKNKSISVIDIEKLQYRDFEKEELLLKQLLDHNDAKVVFLEAHLAKLKCILKAITTFEKDRERLALAVQESETLKEELNNWKQRAIEAEESLRYTDAMMGHSKVLEEKINVLEEELGNLRRKMELKEINKEEKIREMKPHLEDKIQDEVKERWITKAKEWEAHRETLIRERDNMARKLEQVEKEREALKRKEEDSQNRWKEAMSELQEVAAHEVEKKRMSTQLQKSMDEEELNLRRVSDQEELKEWRKVALESRHRAEEYKNEIDEIENEFQSQIGNLKEVILHKDQELNKLNSRVLKLTTIVNSLQEKNEALDLAIRLLQKVDKTVKNQDVKKTEEKMEQKQGLIKSYATPTELEIDVEFSKEDGNTIYITPSFIEIDWGNDLFNF